MGVEEIRFNVACRMIRAASGAWAGAGAAGYRYTPDSEPGMNQARGWCRKPMRG